MKKNATTLASYEQNAAAYMSGTRQVVTGDNKDWLDRIAEYVPAGADILELGSGFGRDATYLEGLGYAVTCSDAVPSFIRHLEKSGHNTVFINVLTDPLGGPYDAIIANMVFLHFEVDELLLVLKKVKGALKAGGVLAFSVRQGEGTEWSNDKLDAPRYYKYWSHEELGKRVIESEFQIIDMRDGDSTNPDKIYAIAKPAATA